MANYVSKHTGAQIDAAVVQVGVLDGKVTAISEEIEQIKDATSNKPFTETGDLVTFNGVEGSPLEIKGAYDNTAANAITAKLVHCGQNIVDQSLAFDGNGTSVYKDGWIVFSRTQEEAEASGALKYFHAEISEKTTLRPGRKYRVFVEFAEDMAVTGIWSLTFAQNNVSECIRTSIGGLTNSNNPNELGVSGVYSGVVETKESYGSAVYLGIRNIGYFAKGAYGTIKYRFWIEPTDDDAIVSEQFTKDNNDTYIPYTGTTYTETLAAGHTGSYAWPTLTAKAGVNNIAVSHGTITVNGETPGSGVIVTNPENTFKPDDFNILVMNLDGDVSGMTKKDAKILDFSFSGAKLLSYPCIGKTGSVSTKKQGSSSISIGEKLGAAFDEELGGIFNLNFEFDEAIEIVEGWGAHKTYTFKANTVDKSHLLNVCSCKQWGDLVRNNSEAPAVLKALPNGGAIDGIPCVIVLNGKFYTAGTFNIPKDGWMGGDPLVILCADTHCAATQFKGLATLNGDFKIEYVKDESDTDWILPSLNAAIQSVMDSDGSNMDVVGQHVHLPIAIDYYIHTADEAGIDCVDKNYLLICYDKTQWFIIPYDRDNTYGNGTLKTATFYAPNVSATYEDIANTNRLMYLIRNYKTAELKARAIATRAGVKSEANVTNVFTNFAAGFPSAVLEEDARRWPLLPATNVANLWRILNWYRLRRIMLDAELDAMT